MGELLKPKVMTKAEAKARFENDIREAEARYKRRCAEIDARKSTISGGFDKLPGRCRFAIENLLMVPDGENGFGRRIYKQYEGKITPQLVSKLSARQLLRQPNAGHTTINTIAAWLENHSLELQP